MRIFEFRSYEARPETFRIAVDLDQVQAVVETFVENGLKKVTALILQDQDERVIVLDDYEMVLRLWEGQTDAQA